MPSRVAIDACYLTEQDLGRRIEARAPTGGVWLGGPGPLRRAALVATTPPAAVARPIAGRPARSAPLLVLAIPVATWRRGRLHVVPLLAVDPK